MRPKAFQGRNAVTCANSVLPMFMRRFRSFKPERIENAQFQVQVVLTHKTLETWVTTGLTTS